MGGKIDWGWTENRVERGGGGEGRKKREINKRGEGKERVSESRGVGASIVFENLITH